MADLIDGIIDWLMTQTLSDAALKDIIAELATRLIDGGIPVNRISIGQSMLHPVFGLRNLIWRQNAGHVTETNVARDTVMRELSVPSPFSELTALKSKILTAHLSDPDVAARYPMFQQLADEGVTGYAAFARTFGTRQTVYSDLSEDAMGASVSFCTERFSGFSQSDLDALSRLITPLCACVRITNNQYLTAELLETYLGRISGKQVIHGHSSRGDGNYIECVLFYSDMRNSLGLSQSMEIDAYLATVNQYFDCTAGAVLGHGGEVLKFIGDGVLAIFPIEQTTRPRANMCAAALSAAREAYARVEIVNKSRKQQELPEIGFGVALHVGSVIHGNVGTEKRLDFTATGPAVGMVSRCEALTRKAGAEIIATKDFTSHTEDQAQPLGEFEIRGFGEPTPLFSYPR